MDAGLYSAINGLAGHIATLDHAFAVISEAGPYFLIAFLAVLWFWPGVRELRDRLQWGVIVAVIGAALTLGVNRIIIQVWERPRPFVSHPAMMVLPPSDDPSRSPAIMPRSPSRLLSPSSSLPAGPVSWHCWSRWLSLSRGSTRANIMSRMLSLVRSSASCRLQSLTASGPSSLR